MREPCTTATDTAEKSTPSPNVEAKAIAAKPSSVALSTNWSIPRPRPSLSEPRMVNGPTQNNSDVVSHPLDETLPRGDPAQQQAAQHDQHGHRRSDLLHQCRGGDLQGGQRCHQQGDYAVGSLSCPGPGRAAGR